MYRKKDRMGQREAKIVSLEDMVPQNHLLRKIDGAIDFDFIYDEVKGMYLEKECVFLQQRKTHSLLSVIRAVETRP